MHAINWPVLMVQSLTDPQITPVFMGQTFLMIMAVFQRSSSSEVALSRTRHPWYCYACLAFATPNMTYFDHAPIHHAHASCALCCLPLLFLRSPPCFLSPPSFCPSPASASVPPPMVRAAVARRFERSICVRMVLARYDTTRTSWMWLLLYSSVLASMRHENDFNIQVALNVRWVDLGCQAESVHQELSERR
jgi:hypothetical protein